MDPSHPAHASFRAREAATLGLFVKLATHAMQNRASFLGEPMRATLEQHQAKGALWVPTLAQLADRMRLMASVTRNLRSGSAITTCAL